MPLESLHASPEPKGAGMLSACHLVSKHFVYPSLISEDAGRYLKESYPDYDDWGQTSSQIQMSETS